MVRTAFEKLILDQQIVDYIQKNGKFNCDLHNHSGKTHLQFVLGFVFKNTLKSALKLYIPIHLLPRLYFQRKILRENPKLFFKKFIKVLLKSSFFISFMVIGIQYFHCILNEKTKQFTQYNSLIEGFFPGFALLLETNDRRQDMALFSLPFLIEFILAFLKKRNISSYFYQNYRFFYAISMAILAYEYNKKEGTIKNTYQKMFEFVWGVI